MNLAYGADAHLTFEDGSTMDVEESNKKKGLSYIWAQPDSNPKSDNQFYYESAAGTVSRDRLASADATVFGRDNGKADGL